MKQSINFSTNIQRPYSENEIDLLMNREKLRNMKYTYPLMNLGNTCYLNATLQCLLATAPLINFIHSNKHQDFCTQKNGCTLCAFTFMVNHIVKFKEAKSQYIVQDLKRYWQGFKFGKQEDSQEVLQNIIDQFIRSCFQKYQLGSKSLMDLEQQTSLYKIFCGKTRSRVHCLGCDYMSDTIDNVSVLCLHIPREMRSLGRFQYQSDFKQLSLDKLLKLYCQTEILSNNNKYHCKQCKKLQKAEKTLTIHETPRILIISFKKYDHFGNKIPAKVDYPKTLYLHEYTSAFKDKNSQTGKQSQKHNNQDSSNDIYDLYGMIIHHGGGSKWGHYTSIVRDYNDQWLKCDDERIYRSDNYMNQSPYILFYQKRTFTKIQSKLTKSQSILVESKNNSDVSTNISPIISCDEKDQQQKQTPKNQQGNQKQKEEEKISEFKVPLPQEIQQVGNKKKEEKLQQQISSQSSPDLNKQSGRVLNDSVQKEIENTQKPKVKSQAEEEKENNILFQPKRDIHADIAAQLINNLTLSQKAQKKNEKMNKSMDQKNELKIEMKDLKSIKVEKDEVQCTVKDIMLINKNKLKNFQRINRMLHPIQSTKVNQQKKRNYIEFLNSNFNNQNEEKDYEKQVEPNNQVKKRKIEN